MAFRTALLTVTLLAAAPAYAGSFVQTNLTSDGSISAANTDPNLKNPWGVSYAPGGPFWVSDNATGLTTLYNSAGVPQSLVVTIPGAKGSTGPSAPTGQVFNPSSTDFIVKEGSNSGAAAFLFATEGGTISGWNFSVDSGNAINKVDMSASSATFKGLAYYTDAKGKNYLYAAELHGGTVDVFNGKFKMVNSFRDTTLESVYAPFNVAVINGNIYVAYAWVNKQRNDVIPHPGWGVVEQVDAAGNVLAKYVGGKLNAPWGLAIAPSGFGHFGGDLLVGNFGDGHITAFTPALTEVAQLKIGKKAAAIDGLWALIVGNGGSGGSASDIYFTAGPNDEANGLFGSLSFAKSP
ncbi:MAG TPA: TIGR03118 family protein [Acetobacteraceae bacterium]|nr:TIGR03118 family protein [Acetobacteraceae bacterium]